MTLVATSCAWCSCFPCRCRRDPLRRTHIRCECACGLAIVAESRLAADVTAAVQRHHVEPRHIAWREREGL